MVREQIPERASQNLGEVESVSKKYLNPGLKVPCKLEVARKGIYSF